MSGESHTTTDHHTIRQWAEARDGKPARVSSTASGDAEHAGVLRINFPGYAEENLEDIDWDTFFSTFEEQQLAFVYQDKTSDGSTSRFNKFTRR